MKENALAALRDFLTAAPALQGIPLRIQDAGPAPGTGGLWPQGVTVLTRKEDVLGGVTLRCRAEFVLRLCLPLAPGDDAGALANAGRLLTLEGWVAAQSAAHTLPVFGDGLPGGDPAGGKRQTGTGGRRRHRPLYPPPAGGIHRNL